MPWKCSCGAVNSAVNTYCALRSQRNYKDIEHYQVSNTTFDFMLMLKANKEFESMTAEEEKFSQFYNSEIVLFASMTPLEQIEHIKELEDIAFEAKARLTAAKTHQRDSAAKARAKEWTVTPTKPDQTVSDSINRVKLRAARMSRLDKQREDLKNLLKLTDDEVDKMIDKMRVQARKDLKTPEEKEAQKETEKEAQPTEPKTVSKPFDASSLFKKKDENNV
jgi:hypothetical protein